MIIVFLFIFYLFELQDTIKRVWSVLKKILYLYSLQSFTEYTVVILFEMHVLFLMWMKSDGYGFTFWTLMLYTALKQSINSYLLWYACGGQPYSNNSSSNIIINSTLAFYSSYRSYEDELLSLDLYSAGSSNPRFTLYIVDSATRGQKNKFAIFIVPQGR